MKSTREVALEILHRLNHSPVRLDYLLHKALQESKLSPLDRNLITEIVNGTLRWRGKIDWILNQYLKRKVSTAIRCLLEIGIYQLFFLNKIPDYAVVNESVEIAKRINGGREARLVNAVLRNVIRERAQIPFPSINDDPLVALSVLYSHPRWLVRRWLKRFGREETIALLEANNRRPLVSLRVNTLKTHPEGLLDRLRDEGLTAQKSAVVDNFLSVQNPGNLQDLPSFESGLFSVQDVSAGLVSVLLHPQKGETILDACAAPGGKTTHMAELMENIGTIIAFEKVWDRLLLLKDNCHRLGIENVLLVQGDALTIKLKKEVDRVLVDVPCSGLGVLAKRPDLRWRRKPQQIEKFARLQLELLVAASHVVKKGGVLVYSTCTTEAEENEQVVEQFLHLNTDFVLEDASQYVHPSVVDDQGYVRTFPHRHHMDGAFAARLVRM